MKPLHTFRVYPEGTFFYAVVNIWPSKAAMYQYIPLSRDYSATCKGVERITVYPKSENRRPRKLGQFAELNFHRRQLGIEVVSHEFTHAAFCLAERRKMDLGSIISDQNWRTDRKRNQRLNPDGVEERFCYALGRMVNQFTRKCYDLGLYEEVVCTAVK